jgi:flagellar basal body-associated protein FliL
MQAPIIQQDHEDEIDRQETCNELSSQLKLKAEIRNRIDQYLKPASSKIN